MTVEPPRPVLPAMMRHALSLLVLTCGVAAAVPPGRASAPLEFQTYTYKMVGTLAIKADVYRPPPSAGPHPVVVWIHGGGLINGGRHRDPGIEQDFITTLNGDGCVFVSIDYRLAPETKLPEIVGDVIDAIRWVREKGPALFAADPARIAIIGSSAGGYLTLTAGFKVAPKPVALVSMWGYGDLVGPWYSEPSTQPRHLKFKPTREEAWRQVAGPPIANASERKGDGSLFYQYCRQHGEWPKAVSGWDPHAEAEKFFPYMAVRNVTAGYPPTLLIHGTADTDVPYEQSAMMAAELARHGVEHKLRTVRGAEHGLKGGDPQWITSAYAEAAEFLRAHLFTPADAEKSASRPKPSSPPPSPS